MSSDLAEELKERIPHPIFLCGDRDESLLHKLLEGWIFLRIDGFKNSPRMNYILLRAIWISVGWLVATPAVAIGTTFLLMHILSTWMPSLNTSMNSAWTQIATEWFKLKHFLTAYIGLVGAISVVFWNISTSVRQQWAYCADVYYKVLSSEPRAKKDVVANSLAIDLLVLDHWAHRLFAEFFRDELAEAIASVRPKSQWARIVKDIGARRFSVADAQQILEEYHAILVKRLAATEHETKSPLRKVSG